MCDNWINVLLQTSTLVGPLHIVNGKVFQNSGIFVLSLNKRDWNFDLHIYYSVPFFILISKLLKCG
jgi:hypothetical protein